MTKIPSDNILEGFYKLRIREFEKIKTVLELYNMEIHQKKAEPDYHRLKTMVKRSIEQNLRIKNFEARKGNYERNAVVKNQGTKQRVQRILGDCWQWKANGQSSNGDTCAVSATISTSVQNRHSRIRLRILSCGSVGEMRRDPEVPEARVPVVECLDGLARITSKELASTHSVKSVTFQNACCTRPRVAADFEKKCSYAQRQVEEQSSIRSKKNGDKSAVAMLKCTPQLGCVFQVMEPPRSSSILRKSSDMQKPVRCVKFTKAVVHHAKIRDQKSFARILLSRWSSSASQISPIWGSVSGRDGTARVMCPWSSAEAGQKYLKLKEKNKTAFFSPSENWCLPESTLKLEEREFVADSGASMHMISKKYLNSDEMDTSTKSCILRQS